MKKITAILSALFVLFMASCQLPSTGSLKIVVDGQGARAVTGTGESVRIQLLRNGTVLPLSGKSFLEDRLAGQSIVIDGIPTGSGYTVNLSTGTKNADGYFEVAYAGTSGAFEVSAGIDTPVSVQLDATKVTLLSSTSGFHSSVVVNGQLTLADGTSFYEFSEVPALPLSGSFANSAGWAVGQKLNSLGVTYDNGGAVVAYNTNQGLGLWSGSFSFAVTGADVSESNAFSNGDDVLNVYSGPGITAGFAFLDNGAGNSDWEDLEGLLDIPSEISDGLDGSRRLFRGFAATDDFAYISTALGLYRIDADMLSNSDDAQALADQLTGDDDSVKVFAKLEGRNLPIGPVSTTLSGSGGVVFAGTSRGLFSAFTDGDGIPSADLAVVSSTYGTEISTVVSTNFNATAYTAAAGTNGDVILLTGKSNVVKTVPRLAGLPSGKLQLTWWVAEDDDLYLVVSGDNGTVLIDVAEPLPQA